MLCLWEWEAQGLRGTENLMSTLSEEGKIFQNVFQSSQEEFGGSSLFGKMQLFKVKKLQPLSVEQQPLTEGFLARQAHS